MDIKQKNKGFTLIELMIVVAVIAIIAGAVLVAINPAKRINESNDSRRWSDVQSLSMAVGTFTTDNGGEIPNCGIEDIPDDGIYRCIGTALGSGYNYTADVLSWWNFDSIDTTPDPYEFSDQKESNHLDIINSVSLNSDFVEGSYSAQFNGSTQLLERTDASLSTYFPGKDGTDNYEMTIGAWVKLLESGSHVIAAKSQLDNTSINNSWFFGIMDFGGKKNVPYVELKNGGSTKHLYVASNSLTIGNWHHVVFSLERDTIAPNYHEVVIYIDGFISLRKSDLEFDSESFPPGSDLDFTVGYGPRMGGSNEYLNGLIDELAVFNYTLTPEQIQEIYFYGLDGLRPCCNLSGDLSAYLSPMPIDPQRGDQNNTGYIIKRTSDNKIMIRAPFQSEETSQIIQVAR